MESSKSGSIFSEEVLVPVVIERNLQNWERFKMIWTRGPIRYDRLDMNYEKGSGIKGDPKFPQ